MESTRPIPAAVRRAGLLLALIGLAVAPATLVPAGTIAGDEPPWPFDVVHRVVAHGAWPEMEHGAKVVPVRFRLGGYRGLDVLARTSPVTIPVDCDFRTPRTVGSPPSAPATGVLTYDRLIDTYTFWWPRMDSWVGTCRWLVLELDDGSVHTVLLSFGRAHTIVRP